MKPYHDQPKIKSFINNTVARGSHEQLALNMEVTAADVSRRFNPNDERRCGLAEAARELEGIGAYDPAAEALIWAFFASLRKSWRARRCFPERKLSVLAGRVAKECGELVESVLTEQPLKVQAKEFLDVQVALEELQDMLDAKAKVA